MTFGQPIPLLVAEDVIVERVEGREARGALITLCLLLCTTSRSAPRRESDKCHRESGHNACAHQSVRGHDSLPFESFRRTSDSERPTISTNLRGDVLPETILTPPLGNSSASRKRASTAAFALPRSAGADTRTRRVLPSHPAILLRDDPATTLIGSSTFTTFPRRLTPEPSC